MQVKIDPVEILGEKVVENLAYIFLEGTYERLQKNIKIPKLTHFSQINLEDCVFFTDTHDVVISIKKDVSAELYHAKRVSIVMHDTQIEKYRGSWCSHGLWQVADSLKFLALYNRDHLREELINGIHKKFKIVSPEDTNETIIGNIDGILNVRVINVTLRDGYYEFQPDDDQKADAIEGVAIEFVYNVILLDERQYDPSNISSDFLAKKSQNWKKI